MEGLSARCNLKQSRAFKKMVKKKILVLGSWITIGNPAIAEIMARSGFDWLAVDMEHSAITLSEAQSLIRVIELAGCVPLVRIGENGPKIIKRVMDAGAQGVIVPMVNNRDDALRAVKAVKYPPEGTRGVGLARAQGYGMGFEAYKKWVNTNTIVIVQIEHIEAVRNLEEILSVKGVDGFIVGPYDLSASLGKPGKLGDSEVRKTLQKVLGVSRRYGALAGFHVVKPDTGLVREKIRQGYRFIAYSLDSLILADHICKDLTDIKRTK